MARKKGDRGGVPQVPGLPQRCPECGSSRCTRSKGGIAIERHGAYQGVLYNRIVRRYTRCLDCGTTRVDLDYEWHLKTPKTVEDSK